jgi:hypothetical protein
MGKGYKCYSVAGKIALELVRNKEGNIIGINGVDPYSIKLSEDGTKYCQVYRKNPVQEFPISDIVITEVIKEVYE